MKAMLGKMIFKKLVFIKVSKNVQNGFRSNKKHWPNLPCPKILNKLLDHYMLSLSTSFGPTWFVYIAYNFNEIQYRIKTKDHIRHAYLAQNSFSAK